MPRRIVGLILVFPAGAEWTNLGFPEQPDNAAWHA
jgi:hypothetical protein